MTSYLPTAGRRFRLNVDPLEARDVPAFLTGAEIAVGADAGSPAVVRLIDPATQIEQASFLAFDKNFYGGVRVAIGDVTGDEYPDLVCAAGPSAGPVVKIYDGKSGATSSFFALQSSFTGGVNLALGDIDGDGKQEIITGAGAAGGPQVSIFDSNGNSRFAFFAYQSEVRSGVRVSAGDVTGDGKADIVTSPGFGGGPDVRVFDLAATNGGSVRARNGFFAYGASFTGGVYVATGDVDGDGVAEIVTGTGPGGGPQVSVFEADGRQINSFFAYSTDFLGGVRVATAELNGSKKAEILTVAGTGGASQVNVYELPNANAVTAFLAFPSNQTTGFFVAGSPERLNIASSSADEVANAYSNLRPAETASQPLTAPPPQTIVVNNNYNDSFPWWWYGSGIGLGFGGFGGYYGGFFGPSYFDAPGLYAPINDFYDPTFFDSPAYYGDPGYVVDPSYYDTNGTYVDPDYDPGYYDPSGYAIDDYYSDSYYDSGYTDNSYSDYSWGDDYFSGDSGGDWGGGFFDF